MVQFIILVICIFSLVQCGQNQNKNRIKRSEEQHHSAMGYILAINANRRRKNDIKRSNITSPDSPSISNVPSKLNVPSNPEVPPIIDVPNIGGMLPQLNVTVNSTSLNNTSNGTDNSNGISPVVNGTLNNDTVTNEILTVNEAEKTSDDLLEGDILISKLEENDKKLVKLKEENKDGLVEEPEMLKPRALRDKKRLWLNRQIPYEIDGSLLYQQNIILQTIQEFNTKTCVKFVPRSGNERDYAVFMKKDGCFSSIGRAYSQAGAQVISIGDGCAVKSIITHEMLHAVGFYHEQSRSDRSQYLKILWENIKPGYEDQFLEYGHGESDNFNIVFNYKSIMQYGKDAFSNGNVDTMQAVDNPQLQLGGEEMTSEDIMLLNLLYDCKSTTFNAWTQWSDYGPCDSRCYKRRQRYCYGSSPSACGKADVYGIDDQYQKCPPTECPVRINGDWSRWSPWNACTTTCDEGVQTRTRTCDNPVPKNNGAPCSGSNIDYVICVNERCDVDRYHDGFRSGRIGELWVNADTDTPGLDWSVGKGSTPTEGTGPVNDPLGSANGRYIYVESSDRSRNDEAVLMSIPLQGTRKMMKCLSFKYHMFGATVGYLYVARTNVNRDKKSYYPLLYKTGSQGDKWKTARITFYTTQQQYRIEFRAVLGGATYSDIALDNLFLDDGECECQDKYASCPKWAARNDCQASAQFMTASCKKSCKIPCGCRDMLPDCQKWGKAECLKNPGDMYRNCPLTCEVCGCHDYNENCASWARQKQCKVNKKYMAIYCRDSCGWC